MDHGTSLILFETLLRIGLGLRFLYSGVSNLRRWPNPVKNARIVFPFGVETFAAVAVFLLIAGGAGLAVGFATRAAALMIALFLLPTFAIHLHWLRKLPQMSAGIDRALAHETAKSDFRVLARQAYHSHETGLQTNLLLFLAALFFALRGSVAFGLDNLFRS